MVTYRKPPIDFSTFPDSDGEPVAENTSNLVQMTDLIYSCQNHLAPRKRYVVGGNQFIYYNSRNGWDHISPDVYVILDVEPGNREKWQTWLEGGKFPDVVFEITSESTEKEALGPKVDLYARLGAQEYYIYDPLQVLQPPFRAFHRQGAMLVPRPLLPGPAIFSPALDAELCVVGRWLRLIDPRSGQPVPVPAEDHAARHEAEQALAALAAERDQARAQLQREAEARRAAEEQAQRDAAARLGAEEQARRAQAALQEALEQLARLQGGESNNR
jgi:Uma2 family endonuclease